MQQNLGLNDQLALTRLLDFGRARLRTRRHDAAAPVLAQLVATLVEVGVDDVNDALERAAMLPANSDVNSGEIKTRARNAYGRTSVSATAAHVLR